MFTYPLGLINPVPNIDPEVLAWKSRVISNSGTVSDTTLSHVDTFVKAIKSAGLRSRFLRLNLFIGDQLAAALTPLFLAETYPATFYGSTYDTNFNFVGGDYSESGVSGGLQGDGATKYLNTGFNPSSVVAMSTNSGYIVYGRTNAEILASRFMLDCRSLAPNIDIRHLVGTGNTTFRVNDFTTTSGTNNVINKLYLSYRNGTSKRMLENGSLNTSASVSTTGKPNSSVTIFASNAAGGHTISLMNCYAILEGISSDTEANTISTLLNDFYTNFSRNEY